MRSRVSPGSRAGSAIARSFSPAFDRHGLRVEDRVRRELVREVVAVDDMHPLRKPRSKRVRRRPHRLRRQRIVIARHEEDGSMRARVIAERLCEPFPEVLRSGSDRRTGRRRTGRRSPRCAAPTSRILSITSIRARDSFFCASSGNDGNRRPDASRPCAGASARRLRLRRRDPERHLEQPRHGWRPVPKLVIFVSPFPVDLVFPGIQRADPALERLVLARPGAGSPLRPGPARWSRRPRRAEPARTRSFSAMLARSRRHTRTLSSTNRSS